MTNLYKKYIDIWIENAVKALVVLAIVKIIFGLYDPVTSIYISSVTIDILTILLVIFINLIALVKKDLTAPYTLIGWGAVAFGALFTILILRGVIDNQEFLLIFPISAVIEAIIISNALAVRIKELEKQKNELHHKNIRDKLTGAYNREFFEQNIDDLIFKFHNKQSSLAIALLDIDHFKSVNDTYGHDVGDAVLIHFVKTVQKFSRDEDIFIRWGGEEFILILKVKSKQSLQKALEHLRQAIQEQDFPTVGEKTCSIGGSIYQDGEQIQNTIKRADEAVYEAKESGRNKVVIH
jgi:diguanylate cyclase (GGDEF)-like protein